MDLSRPFVPVNIAILTVSDTRSLEQDRSGDLLVACVEAAEHKLADRKLIKDDVDTIESTLRDWIADPNVDVVISTGGTGITGRDVTPEAFMRVLEKEIVGFGELFRMLSYQHIGSSTMQSRAIGGVANGTYLFALPGSAGAVKDGWEGILSTQLDIRTKPCNLVELMPRLREHQ
jgi:molybdenum cofactor biosynthesis protein B